jgi:hypothetical protein
MTATTTNYKMAKQGCNCRHDEPSPQCCDITCLSRPNYFCGHLLTDDDLSLEQNYFREKNRLRNKTLTGHGVVCGLRITCDTECCGFIDIDKGYAIDECGNDLIVCASSRFNVIQALKNKKWLIERPEPGQPAANEKRDPDDCDIKQCFYITVCYAEEQSDYTTPFQSGCKSGPTDCQPTRIHETVRFDVLKKPPKKHSYFETLKKRIDDCFAEFSAGHLGEKLTTSKELVMTAIEGKAEFNPENDSYCTLFCQLKAHFLHLLAVRPCVNECSLDVELRCLNCPGEREEYGKKIQDAFCKLIGLIARYANDCILNDLAFSCPNPCEAGCIVIGTVEVKNGKIVRVCNTPRSYVWSFANFWQVLFYTLMTNGARSKYVLATHMMNIDEPSRGEDLPRRENGCCPEYDTNCRQFLDQFYTNPKARNYAALSPVTAFESMIHAMYRSFDFTDTSLFSAAIFNELKPEQVPEIEKNLGTNINVVQPGTRFMADPFQKFTSAMLVNMNAHLIAVQQPGAATVTTMPDFFAMADPSGTRVTALSDSEQKIKDLETKLQAQDTAHTELLSKFADLSDKFDQLSSAATTSTKKKKSDTTDETGGGGNQ